MNAPYDVVVDRSGVRVVLRGRHPVLGDFEATVWSRPCRQGGEAAAACLVARGVAQELNRQHQEQHQQRRQDGPRRLQLHFRHRRPHPQGRGEQ